MAITTYTSPSQSQTMTGPLVTGADPETAALGGITVNNGGVSLTGGLQYDTVYGLPATSISQTLSGTTSTITMTGSGRVIFINPTATLSTCILTPTASTNATTTTFTNGTEVTLINMNGTAASTLTIPAGSAGSGTPAVTISGTAAARFIYSSQLAAWLHLS